MTSNASAKVPPYGQMVDASGAPLPWWYAWFLSLNQVTGGGSGIVVSGANFAPVSANQFFAGPVSGGQTKPFFRPIETADLDTVAGAIPGVANNSLAQSGAVGEYISQNVTSGVSLTSATPADIASITLSAGDWDVWGNFGTVPSGGASQTLIEAWINTASATNPTPPNNGAYWKWGLTAGEIQAQIAHVGMMQLSLPAVAPVYLSTAVTFTGGTMGGYGFIGARRRR